MSIKRNARQRKKMHLNEFQELGFLVSWSFADETPVEQIDQLVDNFIEEVIAKNGLAYEGDGYLNWQGLVCLEQIGKCDDSHRELVSNWLAKQSLQSYKVGTLFDIWWDFPKFD